MNTRGEDTVSLTAHLINLAINGAAPITFLVAMFKDKVYFVRPQDAAASHWPNVPKLNDYIKQLLVETTDIGVPVQVATFVELPEIHEAEDSDIVLLDKAEEEVKEETSDEFVTVTAHECELSIANEQPGIFLVTLLDDVVYFCSPHHQAAEHLTKMPKLNATIAAWIKKRSPGSGRKIRINTKKIKKSDTFKEG